MIINKSIQEYFFPATMEEMVPASLGNWATEESLTYSCLDNRQDERLFTDQEVSLQKINNPMVTSIATPEPTTWLLLLIGLMAIVTISIRNSPQ